MYDVPILIMDGKKGEFPDIVTLHETGYIYSGIINQTMLNKSSKVANKIIKTMVTECNKVKAGGV